MVIIRVFVFFATVAHAFRYRNATERIAAHAASNQIKKFVPRMPKTPLPRDCKQMVQRLEEASMQSFSHQCEDQGQYSYHIAEALKKDDRKLAMAAAIELFAKCGKMSKACAEKMAPGLVEEVRLSGMTVSDECRAQTKKLQGDKAHLKGAAECDKKEKFSEKVMAFLEKDDLHEAVNAAEQSLTTCMKLSNDCAHQVAPILVNSLVMRAMEQAATETEIASRMESQAPILLVEQPVLFAVKPGREMSLLGQFAATNSQSAHKSLSFLQKDPKILPWMSKLILNLALKNA